LHGDGLNNKSEAHKTTNEEETQLSTDFDNVEVWKILPSCVMVKINNSTDEECIMCVENPIYIASVKYIIIPFQLLKYINRLHIFKRYVFYKFY